MAEVSLIDVEDVRDYSDLQSLYNTDRFDTYVNRAQKRELRDLLKDALYYDMFLKVTDIDTIAAPYSVLVNGTTYTYNGETIQYYGIKPFLVFHFLALLVIEDNTFFTDSGPQMFQNPDLYARAKNLKELKNEFLAEAARYGNEVIKFLEEHKSTYTKWEGSVSLDPVSPTFRIR
jgi:hypothetical protein